MRCSPQHRGNKPHSDATRDVRFWRRVTCAVIAVTISAHLRTRRTRDVGLEGELAYLSEKIDSDVAEKVDELLTRYECEHFYIDMGTNIGVQIRKLYEPEKYRGAAVHSIFETYFGTGSRCKVCAIGFEPNPAHKTRNARVQQALTDAGFGVAILPAAVSAYTGYANFAKPSVAVDEYEDWGGSISSAQNVQGGNVFTFTVARVNVARVIRQIRSHLEMRKGSGKIVAKCDIEGSEFEVLPSLVMTQTICLIDYMWIEWHLLSDETLNQITNETRVASFRSGIPQASKFMTMLMHQLTDMFSSSHSDEAACPTIITTNDDESFLHDGIEFPTSRLCEES